MSTTNPADGHAKPKRQSLFDSVPAGHEIEAIMMKSDGRLRVIVEQIVQPGASLSGVKQWLAGKVHDCQCEEETNCLRYRRRRQPWQRRSKEWQWVVENFTSTALKAREKFPGFSFTLEAIDERIDLTVTQKKLL
jgi:hypothetical protein